MPNESPPDLPANIRAEIARSGKPVTDVMEHLDMSASTWYRRMKENPRSWRWGELLDLASFLGISVTRLIGGTS
jgi:hypothetical protein